MSSQDPEGQRLLEKKEMPTPIKFLVLIGMLNYATQWVVDIQAFRHMKNRGWASDTDPSFYAQSIMFASTVYFLGDFVMGWWATNRGYNEMLLGAIGLSVSGVFMMALTPNKYVFALGWALSWAARTTGPVSSAYITQHVDDKEMQAKARFRRRQGTPLGCLVGPAIVIVADWAAGQMGLVDAFDLSMYLLASLGIVVWLLFKVYFPHIRKDESLAAGDVHPKVQTVVKAHREKDEWYPCFLGGGDGDERCYTLMVYFVCAASAFSLSYIYDMMAACLAPLLITHFGMSRQSTALLYMVVPFASVASNYAGEWLKSFKWATDRVLWMVMWVLMLASAVLFSAPPLSAPGLVAGFALNYCALVFFLSVLNNVYGNLLGKGRATPLMQVYLHQTHPVANIVAGGAANYAILWAGTWKFTQLMSIPAAVIVALTLVPCCWRLLDTGSAFVKSVTKVG